MEPRPPDPGHDEAAPREGEPGAGPVPARGMPGAAAGVPRGSVFTVVGALAMATLGVLVAQVFSAVVLVNVVGSWQLARPWLAEDEALRRAQWQPEVIAWEIAAFQIALVFLAGFFAGPSPGGALVRLGLVRPAAGARTLARLLAAGVLLHLGVMAAVVLAVRFGLVAPATVPGTATRIAGVIAAMPVAGVGLLLLMGIAPGLGEEIAFRGFVMRGLLSRWGPGLSITVTAICFAAFHGNPNVVTAFPLGAYLGWMAWRARSTWPAVALHTVFNIVYGALQPTLALFERRRDLVADGVLALACAACLAGGAAIVYGLERGFRAGDPEVAPELAAPGAPR